MDESVGSELSGPFVTGSLVLYLTVERLGCGIRGLSAILPNSGYKMRLFYIGGEGEIRTHEGREALPVFKTGGSHGSGSQSHVIA